jgi:hypothetical protein
VRVVDTDFRVTGVILENGRARDVCLPWPLLIFDSLGWAERLLGQEKADLRRSQILGDSSAADGSRLVVGLLETFLATGQPTPSLPLLSIRQTMGVPQVTTENLGLYLYRIISVAEPTVANTAYSFLFLVGDDHRPVVVATDGLRAVLTHRGPDIDYIPATQASLDELLATEVALSPAPSRSRSQEALAGGTTAGIRDALRARTPRPNNGRRN